MSCLTCFSFFQAKAPSRTSLLSRFTKVKLQYPALLWELLESTQIYIYIIHIYIYIYLTYIYIYIFNIHPIMHCFLGACRILEVAFFKSGWCGLVQVMSKYVQSRGCWKAIFDIWKHFLVPGIEMWRSWATCYFTFAEFWVWLHSLFGDRCVFSLKGRLSLKHTCLFYIGTRWYKRTSWYKFNVNYLLSANIGSISWLKLKIVFDEFCKRATCQVGVFCVHGCLQIEVHQTQVTEAYSPIYWSQV